MFAFSYPEGFETVSHITQDRLIQSACFLILSVRLRVLYHLMEFRIDRPSHCCASRSLLPTLEVLSSYLAHPSAAPLAFPAVHSPRVALSGDASSVKFHAAIVEICPFSWLETLLDDSLSISPVSRPDLSLFGILMLLFDSFRIVPFPWSSLRNSRLCLVSGE